MTEITLANLTSGDVDGSGIFDELMRATKAHIHEEFSKQRIKGSEYATVYLGAIQTVMDRSLQFVLEREKAGLEASLLEQQVTNAQKQGQLLDEQIASEQKRNEVDGLLDKEKAQTVAETDRIIQATSNLSAEAANITKQGTLLDSQATQVDAQTALTNAQALNVPKEGLVLDGQKNKLAAEVSMITAQEANVAKEGLVLDGQKCKLDAEFDVLTQQVLKHTSETALLDQKKVTEQAQTSGVGVDADSVVGRQKSLYVAQTDGFTRDAEQKVARVLVDTWNVRRTTDEGTLADATNMLDDAAIGRAINKLLTGVGA